MNNRPPLPSKKKRSKEIILANNIFDDRSRHRKNFESSQDGRDCYKFTKTPIYKDRSRSITNAGYLAEE